MLILTVFIISSHTTLAVAYTFSSINPKFKDPLTVSVFISSSIPNLSDVTIAYDNWDYLSELDTYRSYDEDYAEVYILYNSTNNGTYASTSRVGTSDWKQITIRPAWNGLSYTGRYEVVAHEMGHAWGLGHSTANPSIMTPYDFIGNAYPQTDDENGIHALY